VYHFEVIDCNVGAYLCAVSVRDGREHVTGGCSAEWLLNTATNGHSHTTSHPAAAKRLCVDMVYMRSLSARMMFAVENNLASTPRINKVITKI
jgi:hypothetical protein